MTNFHRLKYQKSTETGENREREQGHPPPKKKALPRFKIFPLYFCDKKKFQVSITKENNKEGGGGAVNKFSKFDKENSNDQRTNQIASKGGLNLNGGEILQGPSTANIASIVGKADDFGGGLGCG